MRNRLLRIGRWGLTLVILAFVIRAFARNWGELRAQPITWTFRLWPALLSMVLVWSMYAILIEAWRRLLAGWGGTLSRPVAARIWVLSSLGKYVPGKVWAVAGMAVMARNAGVAAWTATASAIVMQALAVATGAAVAAFGATAILRSQHPDTLVLLWTAGGLSALGAAALCWPPVAARLLRLERMGESPPAPATGPILFGVAANLVAWLGYGLALLWLARAVLPQPVLGPEAAISGFAASYVGGLLALFAPGGLVVREGLLILLLRGSLGLGAATALAVASRVLLTITELTAALPFLLHRSGKRRVA